MVVAINIHRGQVSAPHPVQRIGRRSAGFDSSMSAITHVSSISLVIGTRSSGEKCAIDREEINFYCRTRATDSSQRYLHTYC